MRLRSLLLIPLATAALYACGDDEGHAPDGYADVVYVGTVTDEALIALVGALDQGAPADMPAKAPTLDAPASGASLPRAQAAAFSWHVGSTAGLSPRGEGAELGEPGAAWASPLAASPAKPWRMPILKPLRDFFGPVRSAYAHGDPFTGTATYLVFSTDSDPKLLRVLTSEASYTPDAAAWSKLTAAGKPITLTLTGAEFETNRIAQGGGPYKGSSTQFTIAP